jgi:hypothetical protein
MDDANRSWSRYFRTESRSPEAQQTVKALNDAAMEAKNDMGAYTRGVVTPAFKNIARVVNYVSPQAGCDEDAMMACMDKNPGWLREGFGRTGTPFGKCIQAAGCATKWEAMSQDDQNNAATKMRADMNQMQKAFNGLVNKLSKTA